MTDEKPVRSSSDRPAEEGERPPISVESAIRSLRSIDPDLLFRIVLVGLLGVLVWPMSIPVLLGALCAIVLRPIDDRVGRRLGRLRRASPAIVTTGAFVCILVPLFWVGYRVFVALNAFVAGPVEGGGSAPRDRMLDLLVDFFGSSVDRSSIARNFDDVVQQLGRALASALARYAQEVPQGITNLFLFILALYFGLRDGPRLVEWARRVSPVSSGRTAELFEAVRRAVNGTFIGMFVVAIVQGGIAWLAMAVCGVPRALLWAFVAAICSVLPILGTTPVTLGATVWLFLHHRPLAAFGMLAAAIFIGVSDNIVRPWVQSQHDDVHPLLELLSIFGGLAVFGPAGLFLGPVIASMAVWAVATYRVDRPAT